VIVFPAIDLRRGECVRLLQGEPGRETVYGRDPVAIAKRWEAAGAAWLHVVNLDGALGGSLQGPKGADDLPINLQGLRDIAAAVDIPVQFGGGPRSLDDIELLFGLGAARVILGTVAVREPGIVSQAIDRYGPERIAVSIDARDGTVTTHGWQQTSGVTSLDLGREMQRRGVDWAIYTDIARDGMLSGVNIPATVTLAIQTGLQVIASGGVASMDDIHALRQVEDKGVSGVIIGKAIYTGAVDLAEAIAAAGETLC
jgi:phosphoribosylformimino-5-aminoimidazole carboxamide ribotide isomerase